MNDDVTTPSGATTIPTKNIIVAAMRRMHLWIGLCACESEGERTIKLRRTKKKLKSRNGQNMNDKDSRVKKQMRKITPAAAAAATTKRANVCCVCKHGFSIHARTI